MITFNTLGLSSKTLRGIVAAGYSNPTPIQASAIPVALSGQDLIGCAQTGTGKTAAFVLPLLDRLSANPHDTRGKRRVRALVVTPTRELALQVKDAINNYGRFTPHRSTAIYGGVGMGPQIKALRRGKDIIIATPGRLLDHINRGNIDLSHIEVLVLDEADRMLDMGFIHDIRKIVALTPRKRQTLLFSATMSNDIQALTRSTLAPDAALVEVGEQRNPAETVAQHAYPVAQHRKMDLLLHVLDKEPIQNVLVFSRTKVRADRITKRLSKQGFAATALHSNKSQNQRQRALDGFKQGKFQIMVATDIAARGIDVDTISHVINYDTPNQAEDYIHRIGRTGRAETSGDAITFVTQDERSYLRKIERHTGQRLSHKVYEDFDAGHNVETESTPKAPKPRRKSKTKKEPYWKNAPRGKNGGRRRASSRQK